MNVGRPPAVFSEGPLLASLSFQFSVWLKIQMLSHLKPEKDPGGQLSGMTPGWDLVFQPHLFPPCVSGASVALDREGALFHSGRPHGSLMWGKASV